MHTHAHAHNLHSAGIRPSCVRAATGHHTENTTRQTWRGLLREHVMATTFQDICIAVSAVAVHTGHTIAFSCVLVHANETVAAIAYS